MTESCGKCIPCRAGTAQMYTLLTKICDGEATHADLDLLIDLCDVVKNTSLCGLGMTAPNPVLSTLRYFKHEYLEHIDNKRCPTGVLRLLQQRQRRRNSGGHSMSAAVAMDVKTSSSTASTSAHADQTVLEVARENKIFIPTLCHLDGFRMSAPAVLCLVEIKNSPKLIPACVLKVEEGMEITTTSDRLRHYRQTILEMLFAERNHVCSVCVANNHCELQNVAQSQGLTHVRLPYRNPKLEVMPLTSASWPTTTAASSAPAASVSATRSKALTSGT